MPYDKSEKQLDLLITEALKDPEISNGIDRAGLDTSEVIAELKQNPAQIWEAATSELDLLEKQEVALADVRREVSSQVSDFPGRPDPDALNRTSRILGLAVAILVVAAAGGLGSKIYRAGWKEALILLTTQNRFWVLLWAISTIFIIAGFVQVLRYRVRRREKYYYWLRLRRERLAELEKSSSIATLESQVEGLKQSIDKSLLEKRIKPNFREIINRQLNPSYDSRLHIKQAKGLSEVFDPKAAIDTTARNSLRFMLENMPGGSIGIAGSRGAGKTTLLRLFCGPKRILTELKGKPVLAVLVSAPVAYQARDFILYLFASVCQSALDAEGEKYSRPRLEQQREFIEPLNVPLIQWFKPLPTFLIYVGTSLSLLGLLITFILTIAPAPKTDKTNEPASATVSSQTPSPAVAVTPTPAQQAPTQPTSSRWLKYTEATANFLRVMEVKPGQIFLLGLFFIAIGVTLGALFGRKPTILLLDSWLRMLRLVPGINIFARLISPRLLTIEDRSKASERLNEGSVTEASLPADSGTLKAEASDWLKRIKFQQSYTSGWSGSLKLPVGLEGGVNNAITLAENQLSLPEIVHFFTKFVELASQKYQVIIGIDELDKLESDEKAQRFLNDIKSVFGLERCFYLVSVSENAMSSFERRGLPFRDVFDSSFDSIIYVDYLKFESAISLLEKKVVGKPFPFFGLSYALSGGLARDLIRNFRAVMEFRQSVPAANDMESITKAVVHADLTAKIRAMAISVKKISLIPEADIFLEKLYKLEDEFENPSKLFKTGVDLLNPEIVGKNGNDDKDEELNRERLHDLGQELATYVYYATTVLEFFRNTLTEQALMQPPKGGKLDDLARARQVLGVNPGICKSLLHSFRLAHKMPDRTWPVNEAVARVNGRRPAVKQKRETNKHKTSRAPKPRKAPQA